MASLPMMGTVVRLLFRRSSTLSERRHVSWSAGSSHTQTHRNTDTHTHRHTWTGTQAQAQAHDTKHTHAHTQVNSGAQTRAARVGNAHAPPLPLHLTDSATRALNAYASVRGTKKPCDSQVPDSMMAAWNRPRAYEQATPHRHSQAGRVGSVNTPRGRLELDAPLLPGETKWKHTLKPPAEVGTQAPRKGVQALW